MARKRARNPVVTSAKSAAGGRSRLYSVAIAVLLVAVAALGYIALRPSEPRAPAFAPAPAIPTPPPAKEVAAVQPAPAAWVDEGLCAGCHAPQVQDWQGTHHQLAMQPAAEGTVLGDFSGTRFTGEKETTRFYRKGEDFWVNTPDAQGKAQDYKVAYAFGVAPLQQYLLDTGGGRLQALGVAWDTEQHRWFHIYPGEGVDFKDPLHWSKPGQNANFMCVECHTTGFKRNFNAAKGTFDSQWNSLGVGCQACHGPASKHLEWAATPARRSLYPHAGFAVDIRSRSNIPEIETCARCHARRAPLGDDSLPGKPLMDAFLPSALPPELYEVDGKIKGEVFEHGSFLQSKMFAKGVRCTDCHNPHSTELKAPGNGVCLQCHNPAGKAAVAGIEGAGLIAKDYTAPEHHHHTPGQPGSQCVDCHMPGKLFMVNDLRHDHSFSLPNPGLATKIGAPDACLACHSDRPPAEVAAAFTRWYAQPNSSTQRYAEALWAARTAQPGAAQGLFSQLDAPLVAAIRRATLVNALPDYPSQGALTRSLKALADPAEQVREAATKVVAAQLPLEERLAALGPLLADPILAVRIAAARSLLGLRGGQGAFQASYDKAIGEYEQVQLSLQERAEANLNLAMLYQASGQPARVEPYLRAAIERDSDFLPAWVALVQWLDAQQRTEESWRLLTDKLAFNPDVALLQYTKGLGLIRRGKAQEALLALRQANRLEPGNARFAYVLALTLLDQGDATGATQLLEATLKQHPQNREVRLALVAQLRDQGQVAQMKARIEELKAINPGDPILSGE